VPRVSLTGARIKNPVTNGDPLFLLSPYPGIADLCPGGPFPFSATLGTYYGSNKNITKTKHRDGNAQKPTETLNTDSNIRTSTVPKGPHPKLESTEVSAFKISLFIAVLPLN